MKFNNFQFGIFSFNSYVYYVTRGFVASTRAFNLQTRTFNLSARTFSVSTRAFNLATRAFSLLTLRFELATRGFEVVTRGFKLATCGLELVIRHSRFTFPQINGIHQRSSRITYNDKPSSFRKLLEKDNSITKRHRNIKILATGTYKFLQRLSSPLINKIFVEKSNNYSLRGNNVLTTRRLNSVRYGTETVSFLALKIWNILPKEIKEF